MIVLNLRYLKHVNLCEIVQTLTFNYLQFRLYRSSFALYVGQSKITESWLISFYRVGTFD